MNLENSITSTIMRTDQKIFSGRMKTIVIFWNDMSILSTQLPIHMSIAWCPIIFIFWFVSKAKRSWNQLFGKFQTFQKLEGRISKQFANLFSSYTQAFNKMYSRRGSLFIPNFKRREITDDKYLTSAIIYIHCNPIHHGFTKTCGSWTWSSYHTILGDHPTFLNREAVVRWFGNRNEFLVLHDDPSQLSKSLKLLESS